MSRCICKYALYPRETYVRALSFAEDTKVNVPSSIASIKYSTFTIPIIIRTLLLLKRPSQNFSYSSPYLYRLDPRHAGISAQKSASRNPQTASIPLPCFYIPHIQSRFHIVFGCKQEVPRIPLPSLKCYTQFWPISSLDRIPNLLHLYHI